MTIHPLLQAILTDPSDTTLRLAYSDYLEEQGDGARAEFIRVQVELAQLPDGEGWEHVRRGDSHEAMLHALKHCNPRVEKLQRREMELLGNAPAWVVGLPIADHMTIHGSVVGWYAKKGFHREGVRLTFRSGFVEGVRCSLADWLRYGATIAGQHPVTGVDAMDRHPVTSDPYPTARWGWVVVSPDEVGRLRQGLEPFWTLPAEVFDLLPHRDAYQVRERYIDYSTGATARAALSAALVAHARHGAGLPPLG